MIIDPEYDKFLIKVLEAVRPYSEDIVIGGGVACALYRLHPDAVRYTANPLLTKDIDILTPHNLRIRNERLDILLNRVGLSNEFDFYRYKYKLSEDSPFELEFICDRAGLPVRVQNSSPPIVDIQNGLKAQFIDFIDMSIDMTWQINIDSNTTGRTLYKVKVPSPLIYILTKSLINNRRSDSSKKMKDCVYILDTVNTFRNSLSNIADEIGILKGKTSPKRINKALREFDSLFGARNSTGYQMIEQYSHDNRLRSYGADNAYSILKRFRSELQIKMNK